MDPNDPLPLGFVLAGTVSSFLLALSPLPVIIKVIRTEDVGFYRPDAFIVGLVYGIANGTYSLFSGQTVSFIATAITFALYLTYLLIYIVYCSTGRRTILKKFLITILLGGVVTGIGPAIFSIVNTSHSGHDWLDARGGLHAFIKTWLGVCAAISITLLFSGQLTNIVQVIKAKDARSISTSMLIGGLTASVMWMVYSCLIRDTYYMIANGIGLLSGFSLIFLKLRYGTPPTHDRASLDASDPASPHGLADTEKVSAY